MMREILPTTWLFLRFFHFIADSDKEIEQMKKEKDNDKSNAIRNVNKNDT